MQEGSGEASGRREAVSEVSEATKLLARAFHFAAERHAHQRRKGDAAEPYINHLAEVADLVAEATGGQDIDLVAAALLHDAVEDTATRWRRSRRSSARMWPPWSPRPPTTRRCPRPSANACRSCTLRRSARAPRCSSSRTRRATCGPGGEPAGSSGRPSGGATMSSGRAPSWPGCAARRPWLEERFDEAAAAAQKPALSRPDLDAGQGSCGRSNNSRQ